MGSSHAQMAASSAFLDRRYALFRRRIQNLISRRGASQILGYIMQLTEKDSTTEFPDELDETFLVPDDVYAKTVAGDKQHGTKPVASDPLAEQIHNLLKQADVPQHTLQSVKNALQNSLDDLAKNKST